MQVKLLNPFILISNGMLVAMFVFDCIVILFLSLFVHLFACLLVCMFIVLFIHSFNDVHSLICLEFVCLFVSWFVCTVLLCLCLLRDIATT